MVVVGQIFMLQNDPMRIRLTVLESEVSDPRVLHFFTREESKRCTQLLSGRK